MVGDHTLMSGRQALVWYDGTQAHAMAPLITQEHTVN
tara:strand:- start:1035 stop:1145 length:111 start_codon:yes stop_codon:yes gene_type:complete